MVLLTSKSLSLALSHVSAAGMFIMFWHEMVANVAKGLRRFNMPHHQAVRRHLEACKSEQLGRAFHNIRPLIASAFLSPLPFVANKCPKGIGALKACPIVCLVHSSHVAIMLLSLKHRPLCVISLSHIQLSAHRAWPAGVQFGTATAKGIMVGPNCI